jgi:hypothetical protein
MNMQISIRLKDVYGHTLVYPECETAKIFAAITCTKTLTEDTLELIAQLGYKFNIVSGRVPDWMGAITNKHKNLINSN